ncbi:MAG: metallophosphoesterase family protein [Gemmataceae bacterium]
MSRQRLAGLGVVLFLAVGVALTGRPVPPTPAAPTGAPPAEPAFPHFVVAPYLQFATPTGITVLWETSFPGTSTVRYGVGAATRTAEGPAGVTLHEVALTGLEPGRAHVYQVVTEGAGGKLESPLLTFQTAVGGDEAFSFVVVGDTQKNPTVTHKLAALMWQQRPNFVVHLGDVVDNGPDRREWVTELFEPCRELFARVPVYPCIGNHEKNHPHYYRYFALPAPEYHYRYRYGNADFFVLDTNRGVGPASEQYRWLDAELGRSDATWKFVYHHHPAYSSDGDDFGNTWKGVASKQGDPNVRQLVGLYEKHRVDIVFNGHIHVYERSWPIRAGKVDRQRGVLYITSGGGGGRLESFAPVPTFFKAQCRSDHHFCQVGIQGGRLCFKAFDQQGMLFDTFDLDKR